MFETLFSLFEGNLGGAFGNFGNHQASAGSQNGVFGTNRPGAPNRPSTVNRPVVATLHGSSKNEVGSP